MQQTIFLELQKLKEQIDFIVQNEEILGNRDIEKFLKNLEQTRYEIFNKVKFSNRNQIKESEKIDYINNLYSAKLEQGILKIYIPEVLPKFKNINNYAYKNIMLNTADAVKEYSGLFKNNLTLVVILIHENQVNMDIDNKYIKPIIDGLVLQNVIKDDNINNMFYMVQGKNDTKQPYTEVFVMDGKYMTDWIIKLQKLI